MMSSLHNIKKTCASTTNLIKNILNIKDKHITFPDYAYAFSNEKIHGVLSKVFSGLLSYPENPHCCSSCGKSGTVIKHTPKASLIQMIPYQNVRPTCVYTSNVIVVKRADKRFPLRQTSLMNVAIFQTH